MRLTLRTMLAYLDDVLSEPDAEELGNKIERSDFASGLVHKIRNSIGQLRLSSPDLLGHDLMDDPNTVAEFIDSALPPDKEQDFEKVCLQSDKHLAEVASCHQILALVLGTPARVEPPLRERVYRTAGASFRSETAVPVEPASAPGGEPIRRVDQVAAATSQLDSDVDADIMPLSRTAAGSQPDFERIGAGRTLWPIGVAVLVGFLLTAGLLIAMGPLDGNHPLAGLLGLRPKGRAVAQQDPATLVQPATDKPTSVPPVDMPDRGDQWVSPPALVEPDSAPVDPKLDGTSAGQPLAPQGNEPANDTFEAGTPSTDTPFVPPALIPPAPDLVESDVDTSRDAGDSPATPPFDPESSAAGTAAAEPADLDSLAPQTADDVPEPEVIADVGRFFSENELLVFWDDQSGWMRLPSRSALVVGQRLRSLPTYRPQLLLAQSSVQVSLRGRSELTFETPMDRLTPVISLPYGQLLMNAIGQGASRVAIRSGERLLVIEFAEPDTEIAVLTKRVLLPGSDPQSEPPHHLIQIWVTLGMARIDEDGATQEVAAGNQYGLADDHAPQLMVFTELPEWVYSRIDEVDRDAAAELETLLPVGRDLTLSLSENAAARRTDVRLLSSRCLAALNDFEAAVALFSEADKRYQFAWPALFGELQAAVARGPQTADDVYKTFEKLYGGDAGKLYRMLLGYTDEQLAAGAAAELVENLDNDRVEFRILSFENLKRISGKTYLYVPVQSEKSRQSKVARWRTELRKGNLTVRQQRTDVAEWQRLSAPGS